MIKCQTSYLPGDFTTTAIRAVYVRPQAHKILSETIGKHESVNTLLLQVILNKQILPDVDISTAVRVMLNLVARVQHKRYEWSQK